MKVKMKSVISALLACLLLTLAFTGCGKQETAPTEFEKGNQKMAEILIAQNDDSNNSPKVLTLRERQEELEDATVKMAMEDTISIDTVKHEYFKMVEDCDNNLQYETYLFVTGEGDDCRLIYATRTYDKTAKSYSDMEYQVQDTGPEELVTWRWSWDSLSELDGYFRSDTEKLYIQMAAHPEEFTFTYPDEDTFTVTQNSKNKEGESATCTYTYQNELFVGKTGEYSDYRYTTTLTWNERAEYTLPVIDDTWKKTLSDSDEKNLNDGRKALVGIMSAIDRMYLDIPLKLTAEETENSVFGDYTITSLYDAVNYTYVSEQKPTDNDQVIRSYVYVTPYEKQYAVILADETVTLSTGKPVSRTYEVKFVGSKYQAVFYWNEMYSSRTIFSVMNDDVSDLLIDVEMNPDEYRFELHDDGKLDVINEWTNAVGDFYCATITFDGNFIKSSESTYRTDSGELKTTAVYTWNQLLTEYTLPTLDETWVRERSDVTMALLREANQLDALLENHENLSYSLTGVMEGSFSTEAFSTKELFYGNYSGSDQILTKDWGCIRENGVLYPAITLESEDVVIRNSLQGQLLNVGVTTEEVVGQYTENGVLTLTTEMSDTDSKYLYEYIIIGGTLPEGSFIRMRYDTDPETLHIIKATMYLVNENRENEEIFHVDNIRYDVEAPAAVAECQNEYFSIQNATEGVRTITIITDPGTANEKTIKVKTRLGTSITITPSDEYSKLYLDPACTQVFKGNEDKQSDATLYAKSGN